jgi:hypothetical protein
MDSGEGWPVGVARRRIRATFLYGVWKERSSNLLMADDDFQPRLARTSVGIVRRIRIDQNREHRVP